MKSTDRTIDELVADLSPVQAVAGLNKTAVIWLVASLAYVVAVTLALGPLRPGVEVQLAQSTRFFGEMLLGFGAICCSAFALFRSAVPGRMTPGLSWAAALLTGLWVANYALSLYGSALEPSMLGKRPHCFIETLILALPPLLAALYLQRRLYPLRPRASALFAGVAAGLMPAWLMQVACMYEPSHILRLHILPGALIALLAVVIAILYPVKR